MTPFVFGIAGGTASGKTTVALELAERTGALLISHDRYYRDLVDASAANFDHPDALDTALLVRHLEELRAGRTVALPTYDYATHRRATVVDEVHPRSVIVVEGILVLADPGLRGCFDLRVYVDAPDDVRLARRLRRDVRERGRSVEGVLDQYLATVRPMHLAHVEPSRVHADLVLDGTHPSTVLADHLAASVARR